MSPKLRAVIDTMTSAPDRPVRAVPPPIRLSQNEMPWQPVEVVQRAMIEALGSANRYPDYHRAAARTAIAAAHGLAPERVAVDNGSGSLLHGLGRLVLEPGRNAVYGWPSFEAYVAATLLAGGETRPVGLRADGAMDLDAIRAAVDENTALVYLCNPNNPTGGFLSTAEIRDFVAAVPRSVLVVLDEAYREFVTAEAVNESLPLIDEFDNLVIVRTLSKSFGLAGLRVGYALAPEPLALALRRTSVGFALNAVAEAATVAGFSAEGMAAAAERVAVIVSERERILTALREAGIPHLPTQSNFIFIHGDAAELLARFEAQGVLARPFPQAGGARITVGAPQENDAVLAALLPARE